MEQYERVNEEFVPEDGYRPSENVENTPPLPIPSAADEGINHRSQSSSPSSIYSLPHEEDPRLISQFEGVLREETATPSETRREPAEASRSGQGKENRRSQTDGEPVKGGKGDGGDDEEELPNDMNSEPEMVNDSSAEEEDLGEDERTLVETLCQKMEQSRTVEEGSSVQDVTNTSLAELRKLLLHRLLENLDMVEEAGGMRAISYLQVSGICEIVFVGIVFLLSAN